jgi:hypothetical protein
MDKFDFDEWSELARTDPEQFEQKRRDVIESYISSEGSNRRLQG